jgi:hypothetical protein
MTKVYIASSFRNPTLSSVFTAVAAAGYAVHDWRAGDDTPGALFSKSYSNPADYLRDLRAPRAARKFNRDRAALDAADAVVLLTPSGADAAAEAGYAHGRGTPVIVFLGEGFQPGLMHRFGDEFVTNIPDLLRALTAIAPVYA